MKFKEELAVRTKQAEEVIRSFLPFEEGFQKTLFEAMNYSMTGRGKAVKTHSHGMMLIEMFGGYWRTRSRAFYGSHGDDPYLIALIHDDLSCY